MNLAEKANLVAAGIFPEGQDAPFSLPVIMRTRERHTSESQSGTTCTQRQPQHELMVTPDPNNQYLTREDNQFKERSNSTTSANTLPWQSLSGCSSEMGISNLSIADSLFTDDNSTSSSCIASPMDIRKCKSRSSLCHNETSTDNSSETLYFNPTTTSHVYKSTSQLHKFKSGPTFASIERKMAQSEPWPRIPLHTPTNSDTHSAELLNSVHNCTENSNSLETINNDEAMHRALNLEPQASEPGVLQHVQSFMNTAAERLQPPRKASFEHVQPYMGYVPDNYQTSAESRHPSMQYSQPYSQTNDPYSITRHTSNSLYTHHNGQSNCMYPNEHVPLNSQYYPRYVQPNNHYTQSYLPPAPAQVPSTYPPGYCPPVRPAPGFSPQISSLGLSRLEAEALASSLQPAYPEVANQLLQESIRTATPMPHLRY